MHRLSRMLAAGALFAVAACVSSPRYQPPTVVVAPAFRALADSASTALVVSRDSTTAPLPLAGAAPGASVPVVVD